MTLRDLWKEIKRTTKLGWTALMVCLFVGFLGWLVYSFVMVLLNNTWAVGLLAIVLVLVGAVLVLCLLFGAFLRGSVEALRWVVRLFRKEPA